MTVMTPIGYNLLDKHLSTKLDKTSLHGILNQYMVQKGVMTVMTVMTLGI